MRERFNRAVSKTAMVVRPSKVRILPSPPEHMFNVFGNNKKKKDTIPRELTKRVKSLEEQTQKLEKGLDSVEKDFEKAIAKIGIVRFNPFREIGGDQSFSLALLNNEDSGVVVTSHYGKEMQRIYAKPVKKGKSEYSLSVEEEDAIKKAKQKI